MFYYISFLRPPPLVASTTSTEPGVLITPQICNDLRTEYLNDPIDIYYVWSLHEPRPESPTFTKPTKLTSWRADTAYKEILVPPPPPLDNKRKDPDGPSWRLILACGTKQTEWIIALGEPNATGTTPFAVISMPVRFPPRVKHGPANKRAVLGTKQEWIVRSYGVSVPLQDRPIVFDIMEHTSFDLDKKIWDSGIGLASWLVHLFSGKGMETDGPLSDLHDALFSMDDRHILELGAGTGIVSITLAVLRSTLDLSDQPGSVVTTDLPSAMPILRGNIASNRALMSQCIPEAVDLDWEREDFSWPVRVQLEAGLDVIVMADVTYNTASFPALVKTLSRLVHVSKQKRNGRAPKVLMGYKERHPDERSLWSHAQDVGIHFRQVGCINGAGGDPVEIWLG